MLTAIAIALLAAGSITTDHSPRYLTKCGVTLTLPKGWTGHSAQREENQCRFYLAPENWADVLSHSTIQLPKFPVTVTVTHRPFEQEATSAGFMTVAELRRREDDSSQCKAFTPETWLITGGRGSLACKQAMDVSTAEFTGLAGQASYGRLKRRTGYYAGLGEFCTAVIHNDHTVVTIEGAELSFDRTFLPLLKSVRLNK